MYVLFEKYEGKNQIDHYRDSISAIVGDNVFSDNFAFG
jgi:hypothetical protein